MSNRILILGATGTGKTATSLDTDSAAIINLDSRQIWKKCLILTGSPSTEEKEIKPHYLFNYLEEHESWSVGKWINEYNKLPQNTSYSIVGGSIFYARCLLNGLPMCHISSETIDWYNKLDNPYEYYLEHLKHKIEIFPMDKKRLQNHICFWQEYKCMYQDYSNKFQIKAYVIGKFYKDIFDHEKKMRMRLDAYWNDIINECISVGYIKEFKSIIGYDSVWQYINSEMSLEKAKEQVMITTRQYAKSQQKFLYKINCDEKIYV